MQELLRVSRAKLRSELNALFSMEEIEGLCFDLGIDYDQLGNKTKLGRVVNLIQHCQRNDLIFDLVATCEIHRPNAFWREWIELSQSSQNVQTVDWDSSLHNPDDSRVGYFQTTINNFTFNIQFIGQNLSSELENLIKTTKEFTKSSLPHINEAPPIPATFVGRRREITRIKQELVYASSVVRIVSIAGMGGIGKTMLAAVVAHDAEIGNVFVDGILWASLREAEDLLHVLVRWISKLSPQSPKIETDLESLLDRFISITSGKQILLVLDGLDESKDFDRMQAVINKISLGIAPKSKLLVTTRRIASSIPSQAQTIMALDVVSSEDAIDLLLKELGSFSLPPNHQVMIEQLAQLCGNNPLALGLVAGLLKSGQSIEVLIRQLESNIADNNNYAKASSLNVTSAFQFSFKRLGRVQK